MSAPSFTAEVAAELRRTLEHVNEYHADTLLLVARFAGGCVDACDAEAVDVDPAGIVVEVGNGARRVRVLFPTPARTVADVQVAMQALVLRARGNAGDAVAETSFEREQRLLPQLATYAASVAGVEALSPNLLRVVLAGGLDGYEPVGGDEFVYVMTPRPGRPGDVPAGFTMADYMTLAPADRPDGAYYTVRRWDPAARCMELWVVVHDTEHGVSGWMTRARPGDTVALWGPRRSYHAPEDASHHVLVADETGFAAVAAVLETLPAGRTVDVVVETVDAGHRVAMPEHPGATLHWLDRGDREPGTGGALLEAARGLRLDRDGVSAFGAGESRQMSALRRFLRRDVGLPATHVLMAAYWRR